MFQLDNIGALCCSENTTTATLQSAINLLVTHDDAIDADLLTMTLPTTLTHLNKFILVQITRSTKLQLCRDLISLLKIRKNSTDDLASILSYEELMAYTAETNTLKIYIKTFLNSCSCMSTHKFLSENFDLIN
jgi:hypothetical protein